MSKLQSESKDRRKILSVIAHSSVLFSSTIISLGIPLAIILLSDDDVAIANAKEAFNFCITAYLIGICCVPLIFIVVGFPLMVLLIIATIIMPLRAMVKVAKNPNRIYRYPLIWRFF